MTAAGICTLDGLVGLSGFRCIVADPPWAYATRMRGNMAKGEMRAVDFSEYPTMDTEAICGLPVRSVAADGAHLYLWDNASLHAGRLPRSGRLGIQTGRGAGVEQAAKGRLRDLCLLCGVLPVCAAGVAGPQAAEHRDGF